MYEATIFDIPVLFVCAVAMHIDTSGPHAVACRYAWRTPAFFSRFCSILLDDRHVCIPIVGDHFHGDHERTDTPPSLSSNAHLDAASLVAGWAPARRAGAGAACVEEGRHGVPLTPRLVPPPPPPYRHAPGGRRGGGERRAGRWPPRRRPPRGGPRFGARRRHRCRRHVAARAPPQRVAPLAATAVPPARAPSAGVAACTVRWTRSRGGSS